MTGMKKTVKIIGAVPSGLTTAKSILEQGHSEKKDHSNLEVMNKTVAIIGAGPSGLTTAKSMLEQGLKPTLFERYDQYGGVWHKESGNTWISMHTDATKFSVSFSDYPWPQSMQLFPTASQVNEYLEGYVKYFNLGNYILFNSKVTKATILEDKRWLIEWRNLKTNEIKEEKFDFLIVSCGLNSNPYIPKYDNENLFKGKVVHAMTFNYLLKTHDLQNKRVIVVGHSFSGVEISSDLWKHGAIVVNLIKRPYWVITQFLKLNPDSNEKPLPFDFLLENRKTEYLMKQYTDPGKRNKFRNNMFAKICREQNKIPSLYIDPNSTSPPFYSVSNDYINFVKEGKITVKRNTIKSFFENGVILNDGTKEYADIVLFCTGYRLNLDFFDEDILRKIDYDPNDKVQPVILYESIFHPDIPNFGCIGLIMEPLYPIIELQGKWASLIFSGKLQLPDSSEMQNGFDRERAIRIGEKEQMPKISFETYFDVIAKRINAMPDLEKLKKEDPRLYKILWEGPLTGAQYRLNENNKKALEILHELGTHLN